MRNARANDVKGEKISIFLIHFILTFNRTFKRNYNAIVLKKHTNPNVLKVSILGH